MWTAWVSDLSAGELALLIVCLRATDVTLGTLRTLSVVGGRVRLAMVLGFVEILLWVTAVSQTILRLEEHPIVAVAYAGGFALGNGIGILIDRRVALGRCVLRVISAKALELIPHIEREGNGRILGLFRSDLPNETKPPAELLFAVVERRYLQPLIQALRGSDPEVVYVVDRFAEATFDEPLPNATGWRARLKKK